MTLDDIRARLEATKGSGIWLQYAIAAGLHPLTVAEIARGETANPRQSTKDRLASAIRKVDKRTARAAAQLETEGA